MSNLNTVSVSEFKQRIANMGGRLNDYIKKLYYEGKKLRVEVKPHELNTIPSSSSMLYARTIIPIYVGKGGRVRQTRIQRRLQFRQKRRTIRNGNKKQ
jgi:bifunctional DNase/RNase